jgi:hypothetical protein
MDVWGLILSGVRAVLIAIGQEIIAGVTAIWLRAREAILFACRVPPHHARPAPDHEPAYGLLGDRSREHGAGQVVYFLKLLTYSQEWTTKNCSAISPQVARLFDGN